MAELEVAPGTVDKDGVQKDAISFRSTNNQSNLVGYLWHAPQQEARGVLQLIHGMVEFIDRYDSFARFMAAQGFIVVGHDQVGHGDSVSSRSEWGHFEPGRGAHVLIEDVHRLRKAMESRHPDLPYVMLGHSMGSFVLRNYIQDYSDGLSGAIICGTGWMPAGLLKAAQMLSTTLCKVMGSQARTKLLDSLVLGSYARSFPGEASSAWITRDLDEQQRYAHEPRNQFKFSVGGYHEVFFMVQRAQEERLISRVTKSLPLLIISGDKDPVGRMGEGPKVLYKVLQQLNFSDVELIMYKDYRHEILNELGKETVYKDVLAWLEHHFDF